MLRDMATAPSSPKNGAPETASAARPAEIASHLRFAVMRLSRRLRQHAPAGITPSQLSALAVVVRDGPLTLSQLAQAERVQPPTITRVVDSLVQSGFVTRTTAENDRRVAWVEATSSGAAVVEGARKRRDAYLAQHLRKLSPADVALLERAATLLERLTEDPAP